MCHELTNYESTAIKPMLPNKLRGVPRMATHASWVQAPPHLSVSVRRFIRNYDDLDSSVARAQLMAS
jgi:hypothetical protein